MYVVYAIDNDDVATVDFSIVSQVPSYPAFSLEIDPISNETLLTTPLGLDRETTVLFTIVFK